jgi:hypothetical protein
VVHSARGLRELTESRALRTNDRWALLLTAGLAVAFLALLWPSAADAQRPLRKPCLDPKRTLSVVPSGGAASFTGQEPLLNCVTQSSPTSFTAQQTCTFHCQHWHTWVSTGVPLPPNIRLSAAPAPGSYLLRWSDNCTPRLGQSRADCTVRLATSATTVTATLGPAPNMVPPSAPGAGTPTASSYYAIIRWTPATDDVWVAGYDVFREGRTDPVARVGPSGTSAKIVDLFCESPYTFRVEAFDSSGNYTSSAPIPLATGRCGLTTPPNTRLHVVPPKRTRSRAAYFHWGSNRTGVTYQCRLDRRAWVRCRPGKRYRNLRRGAHVFRVRARDQGGTDRTPATYRWRIV